MRATQEDEFAALTFAVVGCCASLEAYFLSCIKIG